MSINIETTNTGELCHGVQQCLATDRPASNPKATGTPAANANPNLNATNPPNQPVAPMPGSMESFDARDTCFTKHIDTGCSPLDEIDIVGELENCDDFPVPLLPKAARDLVETIISIHGAAPGLPGAVALGVASASLGKGLRLKTVNSLEVSGNLYILGGGKTGHGKTIVGIPLLKPLRDFQLELQQEHAMQVRDHRSQLGDIQRKIAAAEGKRGKSESGDTAPSLNELRSAEAELLEKNTPPPRTIAEDTTAEKLAELAQNNRGTIASVSSDARAAIKNLKGRYRSDGGTDEDILLKGFSGEPLLQDRITRPGIDTTLCFTIVWLTQLDHLEGLYSNESLSDSGLLPRFLAFRIDDYCPPISYEEVEFPKTVASTFSARIFELLQTYHQRDGEPFLISAQPAARKLIIDYTNIVREIVSDDTFAWLESFAVRLGEQAWRVTLVLHALEHGKHAHERQVERHNALAAIKIVQWFFLQTKSIVGGVEEGKDGEKAAFARDYVTRNPDITARTVHRAKQKLFKNAKDAESILSDLVNEGAIESYTGTFGKKRYRPKKRAGR